jgi:hypothetical protein
MLTKHYIVMKRSEKWWLTLDGDRRGPYESQQVAVDSAIHAAKLDFRLGQPARVSVDEPDDGVPVVYETGLN